MGPQAALDKPPPSEIRLVQGMIADTGEPLDDLPFLDRFMELEA